MSATEEVIQHAPELLTKLPREVYEADMALADALEKWKQARHKARLAKAAIYKRERDEGKSQVDSQQVAREECKELSVKEIAAEADYYRHRAERDYLNNKLVTTRQLHKYHDAIQD